jgi:ferredoxin--NADP+ reductase
MITKEANAIVVQKIELAPGLIKLRVVPDGWELPDFTAGQYSLLGLPGSASRHPSADSEDEPALPDKLILRAYSVASSSMAREYLEFYIAMVRSGALTPRLMNLKIGDKLWLSTHFSGMFTMSDVSCEFNLVLIATGTGVAPYMSMIRTEAEGGLRHRFAVIHGARHSWDLGYHAQLRTLDKLSTNFSYIPIVSDAHEEPVPWKGHTGFVQKIWTDGALDKAWGFHPTPKDTHVFLCGNPHMIDDMIKLLSKEGFKEQTKDAPGNIHLERYD